MSMPGWHDSHARDSQNGDVIGPLTGQIRPPEPPRIGPAGSEPLKPASVASILRCVALSVWTSSSSSWRRSRDECSSAVLRWRAVCDVVLALDEADAHGRDLVALALDLRRHARLGLLESREPRLRRRRVGLGRPHDVHDVRVLLGDAVHELRPLQ